MSTKQEKTILQKIQLARKQVREGGYQKDGRNTYSKYDYFTPEQVESIVADVCEQQNLLPVYNFERDEFGYKQVMTLYDMDNNESMSFVLRTEKGELKATNTTQQMGGTDTYSERYLKMKVFQIKDNNIDPDSQDNRDSKATAKQARTVDDVMAL